MTCAALTRTIAGRIDALDLFGSLTERGARTDTLLLESADGLDHVAEKSLIVARSALRLECREREVSVQALNTNGEILLRHLESELGRFLAGGDAMNLLLRFPESGLIDEDSRLKLPSPVDALRAVLRMPRHSAASGSDIPLLAGYFGYDFLASFEHLPPPHGGRSPWPDYQFWVPDQMVWINHRQQIATVVAFAFDGSEGATYHDALRAVGRLVQACDSIAVQSNARRPGSDDQPHDAVSCDMPDDQFAQLVADLKEHIRAGDVFQIVPSRTYTTACTNVLDAYARLRSANPSPYMFFVNAPAGVLFGSSPETAVKVSGSPRRVEIRPIAGTRRRGRTATGAIDDDLDARLEAELRLDEKELAEHMMLVDLARNDIARVSRAGTRRVDRLLGIDRYSRVMHLSSTITGELNDDYDALHAYVATMNMGTVVGAPKVRAAELLRRYEKSARGPYGGAVGYFKADGSADTCITIRAAAVREGRAQVRAGAGIVYDSDPSSEAAETRMKADAVLRAIEEATRSSAPA